MIWNLSCPTYIGTIAKLSTTLLKFNKARLSHDCDVSLVKTDIFHFGLHSQYVRNCMWDPLCANAESNHFNRKPTSNLAPRRLMWMKMHNFWELKSSFFAINTRLQVTCGCKFLSSHALLILLIKVQ